MSACLSCADLLIDVIAHEKHKSFEDPLQAQDTNALGIAVAEFFTWNGRKIIECFASALDNANHHDKADFLRREWVSKYI